MRKLSLLASVVTLSLTVAGCSSSDTTPTTPTAEATFIARAKGKWLYDFRIDAGGGSVWVSDFLTIDRDRHDVSADIYADEARTTKLFHLEWTASLTIVDRGALPDTFAADIRLKNGTMTAFVDDPALWAAFGLEDCKLVVNQPVDIMPTNCVYPLTRNTKCTELELFELPEGGNEIRPGTPEEDHCGKRPATVDRGHAGYVRQSL